jgi:DNA-directed RNA polymerase specialized sigma24 family protein
MSDMITPPSATQITLPPATDPGRKALDLAVLKRGASDYLDFLDATKEVFYGYLYHRTGSVALAKTLISEIYVDVLTRTMSLWWFGTLSLRVLLDTADAALKNRDGGSADIGQVYVPSLTWLSDEERQSVGTLHDALWSLPREAERLIILSLLLGFTDERIAETMRMPVADVTAGLATARDLLLTRWQPTTSVAAKLQSLVFAPAIDIQGETALRFSVVEKYNALRFRRYQWVIIGGMFALMSNVIVASVLAFAVIAEPPSSLKGTRSQVASLDAVLLQRQMAVNEAKQSIAKTFQESQGIVAYDVARGLTDAGLSSGLEAFTAQQKDVPDVDRLLKLMQRAQTAFAPVIHLAMEGWSIIWNIL